MSIKVASIIGVRPQFVKAAVVSRALKDTGKIRHILIHTGQHYDDSMSGVFFRELGMAEPDFNLGIGSGPHGKQTGMMLQQLEEVLLQLLPDRVLVYGDTNSTLAGALAAAKLNIPIAHVEAGLRSFNRRMPEEINRVITDSISDLLFTPSDTGTNNLLREGVPPQKVHQVGDVMFDAVNRYGQLAESSSNILNSLGITSKKYILATVHRVENTDSPILLNNIISALDMISSDMDVVLPLHPRTKAALKRDSRAIGGGRFIVTEPAGYLDMLMLEKNAALIATDSGGLQKEAFFLGVPCVVLRTESEWVELLETGQSRLCPPVSTEAIVGCIKDLFGSKASEPSDYRLYGTGDAGVKIAEALLAHAIG